VEDVVPKRRKAPKNTFWRAAVLWGRIKVKGRDIKWSLRTNDPYVAAARVQAERERQIAAAYYRDDRKSCQDVMQAWAEHHIPHHVSPNTAKRYLVSLGQLQPHLEGRHIDEIDKSVVTAIVDARRAAGASTATIRRDLTALSSVLGYAADQEWRSDDNPALARLRKLKERRDPIVLPELTDVAYVIQRCPGSLAALVETARKTGCRQDELVSAERSKLDYRRRQLTIRGKGNKVRVIDLDEDAYEILRTLPIRIGCPHLFWHHDGQPYRNIASRFAAIVKAATRQAIKDRRDFRPFPSSPTNGPSPERPTFTCIVYGRNSRA
jgi:integrase/recombinase XerD